MRYGTLGLIICCATLLSSHTSMAQDGETNFNQICVACHSIGNGKMVGPDLAGVANRRSEEWLLKFVKSSQAVVNSGDKTADSLFKAFNQIVMPDQPSLDDKQIKDIIAYITSQSHGAPVAASDNSASEVATGNSDKGKDLFVGNTRFANGGPACNSCHNVSLDGFVSGGALAKDLTQAVSRLTLGGAKGFFGGPTMPMPQMQQSYSGRPLTADEVNDVLAFLSYSNEQAKNHPYESNIGNSMLIGGIAGVIVLLALFSMFWIKRKKKTVNYRIFERQMKSS